MANALTSDEKKLRKLTLKDELIQKIDSSPKEVLDRKEAESLRALIRVETGWDRAKSAGIQAVPQGDAYEACQRLLIGLRAAGLFVVPVGELERFAPGVPGHCPSWVSAVLEQKLHEAPGRDAIEFVQSIRDAVTL